MKLPPPLHTKTSPFLPLFLSPNTLCRLNSCPYSSVQFERAYVLLQSVCFFITVEILLYYNIILYFNSSNLNDKLECEIFTVYISTVSWNINVTVFLSLHQLTTVPVSYTHLDVYKRQLMMLV